MRSRRRLSRCALIACAGLMLGTGIAQAQQATGTVRGRVISIADAVRACLDGTRFVPPDDLNRLRKDVLARPADGTATAFEVVQELRPHYLRARGPSSGMNPAPAYPIVYLNDFRAGGLEALRSIRIVEIEEIRYISAADATTRWGTGHTAGVIQVRSQH